MNEAFIKNSENEINHHDGDDKQKTEPLERALKLSGSPLKSKGHRCWHTNLFRCSPDEPGCSIERDARLQVELECNGRELTNVVRSQWRYRLAQCRDR